MTPALPGEAPDPSATPRLDALLKEVEALFAKMCDGSMGEAVDASVDAGSAAPLLAAMLRVAVEALGRLNDPWGDAFPANIAGNALVRIERIAAGESGPPEGQAMAKGEV